MKLAPHEVATPLWGKLQAHYETRLTACRNRLEARIDEVETNQLRTEIKIIKELLGFADQAKK